MILLNKILVNVICNLRFDNLTKLQGYQKGGTDMDNYSMQISELLDDASCSLNVDDYLTLLTQVEEEAQRRMETIDYDGEDYE